jgi:hypothetical protein
MKKASSFAIAAALVITGTALSAPASAQKKGKQAAAAAAQPAGWAPKLSKEEVAALQPVEKAITAKDWAAATAALPAAQAAAKSPDALYYIGQFQLGIASGTNNPQLQAQAIDTMVSSGGGDQTKMAPLYRAQGQMAVQAKDYAKAQAAYARWAQLAPNDPEIVTARAELRFLQNRPAEALTLAQQAIAAQQSAGQQVPEALHLLALQSAVNAKMWPEATRLSQAVVTRSPNPKNWRNALAIYRQSNVLQGPAQLDTLRLMRATKSMDASDEYLALADMLARGRFYAEARSVLEEGFASGKLSRSNADAAAIIKEVSPRIAPDLQALPGLEARARSGANGELALRLAEGYYGHGNYAKASELYRLALQKGGVDANLVNSRLGMALAHAGQRAEAETAFKAVSGANAGLASYWLLWLSQRG